MAGCAYVCVCLMKVAGDGRGQARGGVTCLGYRERRSIRAAARGATLPGAAARCHSRQGGLNPSPLSGRPLARRFLAGPCPLGSARSLVCEQHREEPPQLPQPSPALACVCSVDNRVVKTMLTWSPQILKHSVAN